jgi:pimeloyl-ACP methyl ester carboxylesterase
LTELEWVIRPELEQWADVATFDVPGVGAEPPVEDLDRKAIVDRALLEVDRRDWDTYILVGDGSGLSTAVRVAAARPDAVEAMALGHARLGNRTESEPRTVNKEVMQAFGQLVESNFPDFVPYGLTQVTHGSIGDELAARMLERVPMDIGRAVWAMSTNDEESWEPLIRAIDVPLLFAKHEGCLVSTDEGFEEAIAAFPDARSVKFSESPSVSHEFAEALREFCGTISGLTVEPVTHRSRP